MPGDLPVKIAAAVVPATLQLTPAAFKSFTSVQLEPLYNSVAVDASGVAPPDAIEAAQKKTQSEMAKFSTRRESNDFLDEKAAIIKNAPSFKKNEPLLPLDVQEVVESSSILIDDFIKAEEFLKRAVELMPNDPIVNDHYGDILWKLDRKIQARYFWNNVLTLEDTEESMRNLINDKLIDGL